MIAPARILVTGAAGMVGVAVQQDARRRNIEILPMSRRDLDVTSGSDVARTLRDLRPSAVLHLAAYTAVDRAESEPEVAAAINRDGTANVAVSARDIGARVVFVSTDYVFDGTSRTPYHPCSQVNPVNVYGRTKCRAEEILRAELANHVILRTSWVFAPWGNNFVRTIAQRAGRHNEMRIVADQIGRPTSALDLASALLVLTRAKVVGTFRFANAGEATWYALAVATVDLLRHRGLPAPVRISPIPTTDYPTSARRPMYSVLDTTSFAEVTGMIPRPWHEALSDTVDLVR